MMLWGCGAEMFKKVTMPYESYRLFDMAMSAHINGEINQRELLVAWEKLQASVADDSPSYGPMALAGIAGLIVGSAKKRG